MNVAFSSLPLLLIPLLIFLKKAFPHEMTEQGATQQLEPAVMLEPQAPCGRTRFEVFRRA